MVKYFFFSFPDRLYSSRADSKIEKPFFDIFFYFTVPRTPQKRPEDEMSTKRSTVPRLTNLFLNGKYATMNPFLKVSLRAYYPDYTIWYERIMQLEIRSKDNILITGQILSATAKRPTLNDSNTTNINTNVNLITAALLNLSTLTIIYAVAARNIGATEKELKPIHGTQWPTKFSDLKFSRCKNFSGILLEQNI